MTNKERRRQMQIFDLCASDKDMPSYVYKWFFRTHMTRKDKLESFESHVEKLESAYRLKEWQVNIMRVYAHLILTVWDSFDEKNIKMKNRFDLAAEDIDKFIRNQVDDAPITGHKLIEILAANGIIN